MIKGFNNLKEYSEYCSMKQIDPLNILNDRTPAETKIFLFFNIGNICFTSLKFTEEDTIYNYMKKHFFVFNIENFKPYTIKPFSVGEINNYYKFVTTNPNFCLLNISKIEEMKPRNSFDKIMDKFTFKLKSLIYKLTKGNA
jgi:hypothetical protein